MWRSGLKAHGPTIPLPGTSLTAMGGSACVSQLQPWKAAHHHSLQQSFWISSFPIAAAIFPVPFPLLPLQPFCRSSMATSLVEKAAPLTESLPVSARCWPVHAAWVAPRTFHSCIVKWAVVLTPASRGGNGGCVSEGVSGGSGT